MNRTDKITCMSPEEQYRAAQRLFKDGFVPEGWVNIGMVADPREAIADLLVNARKSKRKMVLVECGYESRVISPH